MLRRLPIAFAASESCQPCRATARGWGVKRWGLKYWIVLVVLANVLAVEPGSAQTEAHPDLPGPTSTPDLSRKNQFALLPAGEDPENRLGTPFIEHLALDQKQFWTAPFHINRQDARVFLPFVAFTGALVAGDAWISRQVPEGAS